MGPRVCAEIGGLLGTFTTSVRSKEIRAITQPAHGSPMSIILSDFKLIFRRLLKSPGFSATAILMLAFGIGATTAIFSIVDGVLLRPLPFPESDRLGTLGDQVSGTDWGEHD